jgi:hypothetical protein
MGSTGDCCLFSPTGAVLTEETSSGGLVFVTQYLEHIHERIGKAVSVRYSRLKSSHWFSNADDVFIVDTQLLGVLELELLARSRRKLSVSRFHIF